MSLTPRPGILDVAPYVGGESKAAGVNRVIRLASNENPLGPSAQAIAAYEAEKGQLHRYPDGGARELRQAIAEGLDIPATLERFGSDNPQDWQVFEHNHGRNIVSAYTELEWE